MASPVFAGELTLEDVLELSVYELRDELSGRYIDPKGMSKVEMQKALFKTLSPVMPVAPVVTQSVLPRTALSPQQQVELEVMKLKMESEEREEERQALEKKSIERQERAEALEKTERQEAEALEKR